MPESSTNVEPKGKKDNLKRRNSAQLQSKHIEVNLKLLMAPLAPKRTYKN